MFFLEHIVQLRQALALGVLPADERGAQRVGYGGNLQRLPAPAGNLAQLLAIADGHIGHVQGIEDADAAGAL
jgi:hypothetical protein